MTTRWYARWLELLRLDWMTGADNRISFTKTSVVIIFAAVIPIIIAQRNITWALIALVLLLACIPFGLRGINTFIQYINRDGPT